MGGWGSKLCWGGYIFRVWAWSFWPGYSAVISFGKWPITESIPEGDQGALLLPERWRSSTLADAFASWERLAVEFFDSFCVLAAPPRIEQALDPSLSECGVLHDGFQQMGRD